MQLTHDHEQIRDTLKRYIDEHINPHVDEWEAAEIFPAHQVFKGLGDLGLLGLTKPVEYGGMGLDYSYSMVMAETLGLIKCGGVPMAIGVQTDMCTPALARFGSDELKRQFLAPAIAGDMVGCIGVSEPGAGSDVAGLRTTAKRVRRRPAPSGAWARALAMSSTQQAEDLPEPTGPMSPRYRAREAMNRAMVGGGT